MKEADFLRYVTDVARRFGWTIHHVPAPMRAARGGGFVGAKEAAGLPDLIMLHPDPPRLIFAELKGTGGKLSADQQAFLQAAKMVAETTGDGWLNVETLKPRSGTVGVYVWAPGDEPILEQILRSRVLI